MTTPTWLNIIVAVWCPFPCASLLFTWSLWCVALLVTIMCFTSTGGKRSNWCGISVIVHGAVFQDSVWAIKKSTDIATASSIAVDSCSCRPHVSFKRQGDLNSKNNTIKCVSQFLHWDKTLVWKQVLLLLLYFITNNYKRLIILWGNPLILFSWTHFIVWHPHIESHQ